MLREREHFEREPAYLRIRSFLESILDGLKTGAIVLDGERRVQLWNRASAELWGLRTDEVQGVELAELDFGLPVVALDHAIRDALASGKQSQLQVDALNRRGRTMRCVVRVEPLGNSSGPRNGVIVLVHEPGSDGGSGAAE